ncbi:DNA-methyltransferase subunit M [Nonlabens ulvanivorans]|nr:DNA-methyltransferase subunit M [Nonlabens ulvanivorans]
MQVHDVPENLGMDKFMDGTCTHNYADRTSQSFLVPFTEIQENDWDLSINRYKEIVYEEVEYDAPDEIIDRIKSLTKERNEILEKLNSI